MTAVAARRDEFLSFVSDIALVVSDHIAVVEQAHAEEPKVLVPAALTSTQRFLLDREKVVWHWPDLVSRMTEDAR